VGFGGFGGLGVEVRGKGHRREFGSSDTAFRTAFGIRGQEVIVDVQEGIECPEP